MNYKRLFIPNSLLFITIVTNNRIPVLIDNINVLRLAFKKVKSICYFDIIAIVVNSEHIHMIIKPDVINNYPKIIGLIKKTFTQLSDIKYQLNNFGESDIWQRRYWEHTIRNTDDLYKHIDYIHYNPVKHNLVKSPKDWKYSSFHKFVQNGFYDLDWCNAEDKYNINDIDFE